MNPVSIPRYQGERISLDALCRRTADPELFFAPGLEGSWLLELEGGGSEPAVPPRALGVEEEGRTLGVRPHYPVPPRVLARLADVWVYGHSLVMFDAAGRAIEESFDSDPDTLFAPLDLQLRGRLLQGGGTPIVAAKPYLMLSNGYSYNYFHWNVEALPRLAVRSAHPQAAALPILIAACDRQPYAEAMLRECLGDGGTVGLLPNAAVHFKTLFVPSLPTAEAACNRRVVGWHRSAFGPTPAVPPRPGRRLFVGRADAGNGRRIVNEDAVFARLAPLGFEVVSCSALTQREQRALFAAAEAIVFVHGAAATNLLHAPTGCRVLEIVSPYYLSNGYCLMAQACGHRYAYYGGGYLRDRDQSATPYVYQDFRVDDEAFAAVVAGWLGEREAS